MRRSRSQVLFSDDLLWDVIELRRREILKEIDSLAPNYILNANLEDLCEYFEKKYHYDVTILKMDGVCFEQDEADIDISQDLHRAIFDRSQPFNLKGTRVTFIVPFDGDHMLFRYRPSAFTTVLPYGEVRDNELRLEYDSVDHNDHAIRNAFDRSLREVQQYLGFAAENINQFNNSFMHEVRQRISQRREKLMKDQGLAASLGFPMRKREGVPQTYSVPVSRKALKIQLPKATIQPFKPEATLEMQGYEQILATISNMALVLERSPSAFAGMKEEDLRTHFLVGLNGQFEGRATGETFNYEGKTDILVRDGGRNLFIAECKFWKGSEALKETIDQLLGYTSWRDTKTAIILFNRNKNLSSVLQKIPDSVAEQSNFKRQLDYQSDTGFRFILRQKSDPNRDVMMTVLVFDIPTQLIEEN
jgi:hypothetical protein